MGYHRAGFEVVGVDIAPQPRYPFEFIQGDAFEVLEKIGAEFDAIHASPPCQGYLAATRQWRKAGRVYPDLISETRDALVGSGKPYIIENVRGSPLLNPTELNGGLFDMLVHRPRLFETSFDMPLVLVPQLARPVEMGRPVRPGDVIQPVGHFSGVEYAREQMGIDWMTGPELSQAIPPAYTEFIGRQLIAVLERTP